jgi:hypothetical protein
MGGQEQPSKLKSDKNFARAQVPMIQYTEIEAPLLQQEAEAAQAGYHNVSAVG